MRSDRWHLTEDVDDFLARAGDFLRSRPALHTMPLTVAENVRTRGAETSTGEATLFGRLEAGGGIRAVFYRRPSRPLALTVVSPEQADTLAAELAGLDQPLPGVSADHDTATVFAAAWQRHTGAGSVLSSRVRLYRLGVLSPPVPNPAGLARPAGEDDRGQVIRWCGEFAAAVGETPVDAHSWARSRFADKHFTFWKTPAGDPVSMAGATSMVGGMVRVDPVYTPAQLRGRGYAAAVTVEVSGAALAGGATDVVLFADPANPTSNALYQRIGYRPLADFAGYDFTYGGPRSAWDAGGDGPPRGARGGPP